MARIPGLAAPTLSPFGASGAGFGAFNITDPGREAYLIFTKAENSWSNGKITDAEYLAAMEAYANALPEGSSTRLNTEQRVIETRYRVERNVLVAAIDAGQQDITALLEFDRAHLSGLVEDSEAYRDRQARYQDTQRQVFAEDEDDLIERYQAGSITTTQLQAWYREQSGQYDDNNELAEAIASRIRDLDQRVLDERDSRAIEDYNEGRLSDDAFLVYAQAARARYATGTAQARDWDQRIDKAAEARVENNLLYRYGLSQQYAELQRFIKSNAASGGGRTSTSTSKRIVLGADGKWRTVTTTSTKAVKPSASEVEAHRRLQIQIADAKRQMAEIVAKIGSTPGPDGFVTTARMISYYQGLQRDLVRGSGDWYAFQEKIDSLQERQHAETVLSQQGIRITYPGAGASTGGGGSPGTRPAGGASTSGGSGPSAGPAGDITIDEFMRALARVESGGRYDARNRTSGAFGKYQIMPANWPSWARKYLGDASAAQTPENQEKVAKGRIADLHRSLGSWEAVAYAWLNGPQKAPALNRDGWTSASRNYVTKVMGNLGVSPSLGARQTAAAARSGTTAAAKPAATAQPSAGVRGKVGGLSVVVGLTDPRHRTGEVYAKLRAMNLPANLDGSAFYHFYSAYERAFNSGAEAFTIDHGNGNAVTYFVGDDPAERIDRMRQLDDLRVSYYEERARAYQGTASEIEAANAAANARRDAAAHEFRILDTLTKGTTTGGGKTANPIAAGNRLLDNALAGIGSELAAAQAAYERGDIAAAYAHYQLASRYLDVRQGTGALAGQQLGTLASLASYEAQAESLADAISRRYGGIAPEEALGTSGGGTFGADLERLQNAAAELATALSAGDKLGADLQSVLKVDERGNPILNRLGQVELADGWARFITPSGKVEIRPTTKRVDEKSGGYEYVPTGTNDYVKVVVKASGTVQEAYAQYQVDKVGWIRSSTGNQVLMGKVVTVIVGGKSQTLYEDPLNPGHWSSSPIVFNAPSSFKVTAGPGGTSIYSFTSGGGGARGGPRASASDGITYSLQFDPKTGTYLVLGNRPGGLFQSEIVDQPVGAAGDANVLNLLTAAGLTRDSAGAGGFVDITTPAFGFASPSEFAEWSNPRPAAALLNQPSRDPAAGRVGFGRYAGKLVPGAEPPPPPPDPTAGRIGFGRFAGKSIPGGGAEPPALPATRDPLAASRSALPSIAPLPSLVGRAALQRRAELATREPAAAARATNLPAVQAPVRRPPATTATTTTRRRRRRATIVTRQPAPRPTSTTTTSTTTRSLLTSTKVSNLL